MVVASKGESPLKVFFAPVVAFLSMSATALTPIHNTDSVLIGTWAVDIDRLPIPPAARPKSVTIIFREAATAARRTMVVSIVDAAGKETTAETTYPLDGSATSISGSPEADTGAMKAPEPNVLVLALMKGGMGASTRIYAAAPNGKEMVETAVYFSKDGSPIMRTNYFSRTD